jgi:hypothetical protein
METSMKYLGTAIAILTLETLATVTTAAGPTSSAGPGASITRAPHLEDIYVLRSLREERSSPGEFCAQSKIGFAAKFEDRYVFKTVVTRASDGKVVDATSHPAGTLRACFDSASGVADANFYAEGVFAGVPATAKGKCTPITPDHPEPGITSVRCFLVLSDLPAPYVAGVLTTNTVTSRQPIGPESNPPGYIQPSIATIRLWRKQ